MDVDKVKGYYSGFSRENIVKRIQFDLDYIHEKRAVINDLLDEISLCEQLISILEDILEHKAK
jgi:hypothetical protein